MALKPFRVFVLPKPVGSVRFDYWELVGKDSRLSTTLASTQCLDRLASEWWSFGRARWHSASERYDYLQWSTWQSLFQTLPGTPSTFSPVWHYAYRAPGEVSFHAQAPIPKPVSKIKHCQKLTSLICAISSLLASRRLPTDGFRLFCSL